jgi:hypothetical protein
MTATLGVTIETGNFWALQKRTHRKTPPKHGFKARFFENLFFFTLRISQINIFLAVLFGLFSKTPLLLEVKWHLRSSNSAIYRTSIKHGFLISA